MSRRIFPVRAGHLDPDWPQRVAALTREAFRAAVGVPGLPEPDGAAETADRLRAALADGAALWVAVDDGALTGALQTHVHPDGAWEVHRVSVSPRLRRGGVAAALLEAVEAAAGRAGAGQIRLNAVVERCLPPIYTRLGYRVTALEPNPDKPLSELVMCREPGEPRRATDLAGDWAWPPRPTLTWFLGPDALLAVAGRHDNVAAAAAAAARRIDGLNGYRLAGVDAHLSAGWWTDQEFLALARRLGEGAEQLAAGVVRCPGNRAGVPGHVMPRTVDPDLYALWRFAPGREAGRAVARVPLTAKEKIS